MSVLVLMVVVVMVIVVVLVELVGGKFVMLQQIFNVVNDFVMFGKCIEVVVVFEVFEKNLCIKFGLFLVFIIVVCKGICFVVLGCGDDGECVIVIGFLVFVFVGLDFVVDVLEVCKVFGDV